jgi:hypothetical protein
MKREVSNLRQYNMVASPKELRPEKDCVGIYKRQTRPLVREGAPKNKTVTVKQ